tara:strand:+ start:383 stop:1090 length:708 start_codon:yes stop_codon:yes gene_type:complete
MSLYKYWKLGWPVIPQNNKIPTIRAWNKYAYTLPEEEQVLAWRASEFNSIGLVLGPQCELCVIDIDVREKYNGLDHWEVPFDHPLLAQSPSGGFHLYYKRRMIKGDHKLATGVELLGDERKVTLPPSNSGGYKWINYNLKVPTLPFTLIKIDKRRKEEELPTYSGSYKINYPTAEEGDRVGTAVKFVGYLLYRNITDDDKIKQLVTQWNEGNDPPLTPNELKAQVFPAIERFKDE